MMRRGLLAMLVLLGATTMAWAVIFRIQGVEHAAGYAQAKPSQTVGGPALTQTQWQLDIECQMWLATYAVVMPAVNETARVQHRLDAVGIAAEASLYIIPTCPRDLMYLTASINASVDNIDDVAQLAALTELFIAATAEWPDVRLTIRFFEGDINGTQAQLSFMIWEALALQEAGLSGTDLLAALLASTATGPSPTATPLSPGDPTPCPPNGTPERVMHSGRDPVTANLRAAGIEPYEVWVMGFQNCVHMMTPDYIGWIDVQLQVDPAADAAALGALAREVIRAAANSPEADLYLTFRAPDGEVLHHIDIPMQLALAYANLDLTDDALFLGLLNQEAAFYD